MARERDPNRDKAYEIWKQHNGNITNREIAHLLSTDEKKIAVWKQRDKWNVVQQKMNEKKNVVQQKKKTTKKARSPNKKEAEELVVESDELTDKQRLFCMYYLKYFNATKAYQKAYQCDYFTANSNGSRLLVNASVKKEIERLKAERAKSMMLDNQAIIQKYIDIAFADLTDFVEFGQREIEVTDDHGEQTTQIVNFVNIKNAGEVDGTIITEIKQGRDGVSIKLADRMKALEELKKYFNGSDDETTVNGLDQLAEAIRKSASALKGDS